MDVKEIIYVTIASEVKSIFGDRKWSECWSDVWDALNRYQPDKPDDGTAGFLAYSVGDNKSRMKIKTGRFLTKKLGLNNDYLNCQSIQKIANIINDALFDTNMIIELVHGGKITDNYRNSIGGSSCMTENDGGYTRMYENNPDRFQQLTMKYCNGSARAIVHKLDNGKYLMDRIYSDNDLSGKMQDYAIKQGWFYRWSNEASTHGICFNGDKIDDYNEMIVSGLSYDNGEVPYMDTLTEYRLQGSKMDIFHGRASYSSDGTLDSTKGQLENRISCENCGETMSDDDTFNAGDTILCRDCYGENYFYCESCNEDFHNNDGVYIEDDEVRVCQSCADNSGNYYQCDNCDKYHSQPTTETNDAYNLCESCLFDKYTVCESCDGWYPSSDINDDGLCADCIEKQPIPAQNENDTEKLPFEESIRNAE